MGSIILFILLWVSALPTWAKFVLTILLTLEYLAVRVDDDFENNDLLKKD